jgi:hypothetical protein
VYSATSLPIRPHKSVSKLWGDERRRAWDTVAAFDVIFIDTGEVCGGRKYYFMALTYYVVAIRGKERAIRVVTSCTYLLRTEMLAAWHKERARQ